MTASIFIVPETIPEANAAEFCDVDGMSVYERAVAMCRTAARLESMGATFTFTDEDKEAAFDLSRAYIDDPEQTNKVATPSRTEALPESMLVVGNILQEFSHLVANDSARIRQLVTNKLIIESEHPDAKVRLKSLELLGKISDVGLFTEKRELTVKDETSDGLRNQLKAKLLELRGKEVARKEKEVEGEYTIVE